MVVAKRGKHWNHLMYDESQHKRPGNTACATFGVRWKSAPKAEICVRCGFPETGDKSLVLCIGFREC